MCFDTVHPNSVKTRCLIKTRLLKINEKVSAKFTDCTAKASQGSTGLLLACIYFEFFIKFDPVYFRLMFHFLL